MDAQWVPVDYQPDFGGQDQGGAPQTRPSLKELEGLPPPPSSPPWDYVNPYGSFKDEPTFDQQKRDEEASPFRRYTPSPWPLDRDMVKPLPPSDHPLRVTVRPWQEQLPVTPQRARGWTNSDTDQLGTEQDQLLNQYEGPAQVPPTPAETLQYLARGVAPGATSLASGEPNPNWSLPVPEYGKVPQLSSDPRWGQALIDMAGMLEPPAKLAGIATAAIPMVTRLAPDVMGAPGRGALRFWEHSTPAPSPAVVQDLVKSKALEETDQAPEFVYHGPFVQRGLMEPQRILHPGIYDDPREIVKAAHAALAPEHPALKQLFGVTREDLYGIGEQGRRAGNMEPSYSMPANPGGSAAASKIMTPQNSQRIMDTLIEAHRHPELLHGVDSWYVMDPAFWRLVELAGPEHAINLYKRFNTLTSMASPGSDVLTEINRGTAANMMAERGQFGKFQKYGGTAEKDRGRSFPQELSDVRGHPYHSTSQALPMGKYVKTGTVDMGSPKVPLYIQASGVPETGFQTKLPVPDAHFTRAVGMSDVRTSSQPGVSMKGAEYHQVGPWFRESVAKPLGLEAVPTQARMWSVFGPQTGVETAIGAPKLEILAQRIWERAQKLGVDPKKLRDDVLLGKNHALWAGLTAGLGAIEAVKEERE